MEQITLKLTGVAPLLMNCPRSVNPLDGITQEKKTYTAKHKKTLDDHRMIARLEWEASLYHDEELGHARNERLWYSGTAWRESRSDVA